MTRYIPKVGESFSSKEALEEKLRKSGWKWTGHETFFHIKTRKIIGSNIFVEDKKGGLELSIRLDILPDGVRVVGLSWTGRGSKKFIGRGRSKAYTPIRGLDPEISDLIEELNEAGYITNYSCAGHGKDRGFIVFTRSDFSKDELEDIKDIFRQRDVKGVTLKEFKNSCTRVTFLGVG